MLLAMVDDIRVIIVKLADRLHNMRTLGYLSPRAAGAHRARDHRDLRAHRAPPGMGKIRGELEDLAFQHLEPDAYEEIISAIESKRHANEEFLDEIRQTVEAELRARRHSGARRRPRQAALLGLPEAASGRRSRSTRSTT